MQILKRIFIGIFGLVFVVLVIVLAIWFNPGAILTQSRIDSLVEKNAGQLFSKKPEHVLINLDALGLWGKHVRIDVTPFCLTNPEACFKAIHLEFSFRFVALTRVKIEEIGPIVVLNESFVWKEQAKKEGPEKEPSDFKISDHLTVPADLKIKDITIEVPNFEMRGKDTLYASLFAHGKQSDAMNIQAEAHNKTMKAEASVATSFVLNQENPFEAKLKFDSKGSIDGNLKGAINWNNLQGNLAGKIVIKKFIPFIDTLTVDELSIRRHEKVELKADLEAKLEPKLSAHNPNSVLPKATFDPRLRGKIEGTESKDQHLDYKIHLGPLQDKGIELEAKAAGTYPYPKDSEFRYGLDRLWLRLALPRFQTLVQSLKRTNMAIPAPFATMNGDIHFEAGKENAEFKGELPLSFVTQLASNEQTLNTESKGQFSFSPPPKKMRLEGETLIQKFKFTMPDLQILSPAPGLKTDSRIVSNRVKPAPPPQSKDEPKVQVAQGASDSSLDMNWKIRTSPSGIEVHYPILKPFAPIEVSWDVGEKKSGEVKVLPFTIEFLKRKARVAKMRYYLNPGDPNFHYEGRIIVPKTEYTIFVDIIQDGDKPKVMLSSSPPLPESDIVSELLFNQTTAELDPSDVNSSAQTQAAVTNRALGFFTILTLSSTPIEAVSYNPSTGVYSARVKLAAGLTATVGTDWEKSQEVALRKRLGRNFVLSTVFQTDQTTNEQTTKTLIEWFRRY